MKIQIECDNLDELRSVVDALIIVLPESAGDDSKEPEGEPEKKRPRKQKRKREEEELNKVKQAYNDLHERILALHEEGCSVDIIAGKAKCSVATVYNHLKKL